MAIHDDTLELARDASRQIEAAVAIDLDALYRGHSRYVAGVAYRLLGRDGELDDIVQDVFLSAISDIQRLRSPDAVRGWLATVTVRAAMRRLRRRKLRRWLLGDDGGRAIASTESILVAADLRCDARTLYGLLDNLAASERTAWTLRHLEGEPLEQVACFCEVSLATCKRRIAAAQLKLEEAIER